MHVFQIGQFYPVHDRTTGDDKVTIELTSSFLNVLCYLNDATRDEVRTFRTRPLGYGLYEPEPGLPFILSDFGNGWLFDATVNLRVPGPPEAVAAALAWPDQPTNRLTYVLLDACTNLIRGLRSFEPAPAFTAAVREATRQQLHRYATGAAIDAALAGAEGVPTEAMRRQTHMYLHRV